MAEPQFIPVDHDPFAAGSNSPPQFVPVDTDPFAGGAAAAGGFEDRFGGMAAPTANRAELIAALRERLSPYERGRLTATEKGDALQAAMTGLSTGGAGNLPDYPPALAAGIGSAISGEGFSKGYTDQLEELRGQRQGLEEKYPGTTLGSVIAGAVAPGLPAGKLITAATLPGRVAQSGGIGAILGGFQGGASGEGLVDRAKQLAMGTVLGGVIGAGGEYAISKAGDLIGKTFGGTKTAAIDVNPAERIAAADEFGVPLTRGQATGNVGQQAFEQAARNEARGPEAGVALRNFDARQQAAMQAARDELATGLGGTPATPRDAGDVVGQGLKTRAADIKQEADLAYLRSANKGAWISSDEVGQLGQKVAQNLEKEGIKLDTYGNYTGSQQAMNLLKRVAGFEGAPAGSTPVAQSLEGLEHARQGLLKVKAANPADGRALKEIRKGYDEWIANAIDKKLFSGDPSALDDLKQARGHWQKYRTLTDGREDSASKLVSKIVTEERTGDEVANWLLGTSGAGQAGLSSRVASQVKGHLGEGSQEWQALRRAAWDKMTNPARGEGAQAKVKSIIDFTRGQGAPLAKELFSPAELDQMTRLAGVMRSTIVDPRAANRGQSGYEIARMMSGKAGLGAAAAGIGTAIWQQDPRYLALAAVPLLRSGSSLSKGLAATRATPSSIAAGTGTAARSLVLGGAGASGRQ